MDSYYVKYVRRVSDELSRRFNTLAIAIDIGRATDDEKFQVDGFKVRMAVDDLKIILAEIRKLK
jgi:hypothetical protein